MAQASPSLWKRITDGIRQVLGRIDVLALFPLIALTAIWLDLGDVITVSAFVLPFLLAVQALGVPGRGAATAIHDYSQTAGVRGTLAGRDAIMAMLDRTAQIPGHDSACILLQIDDWEGLVDRWGTQTAHDLALRCVERLSTSLRNDDLVARLGDARFAVVLHPVPTARLGTRETIAARLRTAISEPIAVGGAALRLSVSIGHTNLIRNAGNIAEATMAGAEAALSEAHRNGPNAERAFAPALLTERRDRAALTSQVDDALAAGEIRAWFQPQITTGTGTICGFEALARWHHPQRGVLTPGSFLDAIDQAGKMEALGQAILHDALSAIQVWDKAGLRVPSVSVNFSAVELRNTALADRVKWEVDRFDLRPGRLTVEILETVAAQGADDAVMTTISALRAHGMNVDLDDFGIGQASLSAVRRFGVNRIKIDRSFILGLDEDPEQQAMVAAILSMARHLGVETLAEGVETASVQGMLAQMGCDHVQGYHLSRPMPMEETIAWATLHNEKLAQLPPAGRRVG